ncbi:MAG: DUF2812 domain-containing protein [Clostridiales bacterium]|nr:DUF2812 domain-containing protein [Clostridiales bacterium]
MIERKTVRKLFWVWEFEKEERWLNLMAQSGWLLEKVGLCTYHFVACTPGEYTIRLEMHNHDDAYIGFMQETGAEYIGRMVQWIFFRKKTVDGEFDIFSDIDSKINHLDKIGKMLGGIGGVNLLLGLVNSMTPAHTGWINLLCATLLMYALGRIHGKKEALEEKRLLTE